MINFKQFLEYNSFLTESFVDPQTLQKIYNLIVQEGGEIYVVGGPIRDIILGIEPKDIDFLVRKLTLPRIEQIISRIGKSNEVGSQFGIVKGTIDGHEFDFAIPRTSEEKTGDKHTDFTVKTDPFATVEADLGRRDLTINSLALDLKYYIEYQNKSFSIQELQSKIIDPYNGLKDIQTKTLRTVGSPKHRFMEDPLRILRAFQFSTRMTFEIDDETLDTISEIKDVLKTVPGDRILEEFKKAWIKGKSQEKFVKNLMGSGVGKTIFGDDYDPIPVEISNDYDVLDKVYGQLVAHFFNGGDYMKLRPTVEMKKIMDSIKELKIGISFSSITKLKELNCLEVVGEVISSFELKLGTILKKGLITATSMKDLDVNGKDLMEIGLKGKEIGSGVESVLREIWAGKLDNNKESIIQFLKNLKTVR